MAKNTKLVYDIGFTNSKGISDETQLDITLQEKRSDEICELINLLLSLKDEMDIKTIDYIDLAQIKGEEDKDKEKTIMPKGTLIGYGINLGHIKKDGSIEFERFTTVGTLEKAENIFNALTGGVETHYWEEVEIEEIYETGTGDHEYNVIKNGPPLQEMENKQYWDRMKMLNAELIHGIDIREDQNPDGSPINICWLKLGYLSPSSGCGYFHYSSIAEFLKGLKTVKHVSDPGLGRKDIEEYLWWLEDNEVLFDKDIPQIAQICEMLTFKKPKIGKEEK